MRLRVQEYSLQTDRDSVIDCRLEQLAPDVATALFLKHRHATDLTGAREQSRGAERQAHFVQREKVCGVLIESVPFEFYRNALLLDEDSLREWRAAFPGASTIRP